MTHPELAAGYAARDSAFSRGVARHGAAYRDLVLLARNLARLQGAEGITVADLRECAQKATDRLPSLAPLFTGDTKGTGKRLCWLGGVLAAAGLVPTDRTRRSHIPGTHGNRNVVYLHPEVPHAD